MANEERSFYHEMMAKSIDENRSVTPPADGLYRMDCMALLPLIPDEAVSLILTDPPYGISYQNQYTKKRHPVLAGDHGIDYERFSAESYRILKENAHAYFLPGLTVIHIISNACSKPVF